MRPEKIDFAPHYEPYVNLVPDGDILDILKKGREQTCRLLKGLNEEQASFRYQEGKWSIKEVIGHLADTERYLSYRLFCIARGEQVLLPSHDEERFVRNGGFSRLPLSRLLEDFRTVRESTLSLLEILPEEAWNRKGNAAGYPTTVRALAYIIAGHEIHHGDIIRKRYLESPFFPK